MKPPKLRVVVFQEGDWLCAQCLEYDLGTQARTLEALLADLQRVIWGHIAICAENDLKPFSMLRRAPKKYWDMFRRSKICLPPHTFGFKVSRRGVKLPRPEIRVAPVAA
ncbi:MAG: hypothetical protein Q8S13_09590 [Dehalococcoidia bacterium]|nr:hypothetical protein [Dehalococcoidia bacterium]